MYSYESDFIDGYIDCALWSSNDDDGKPLDGTGFNLSDSAVETMRWDCRAFIRVNRDLLERSGLSAGQAGHNFWLTQNGHGTGFWDRGLGEVGEALSKAAKIFGECNLYVSDNETVEVM